MRNILLIAKSNTYPKNKNGGADVIYAIENELSEIKQAETNGLLEYYVLVLIKTVKHGNPNLENVKTDWNQITGGHIAEFKFLTEDSNRLTKPIREMFKEWYDETIRFKLPVVGFKSESEKSRKVAHKMLIGSAVKKRWEFWK